MTRTRPTRVLGAILALTGAMACTGRVSGAQEVPRTSTTETTAPTTTTTVVLRTPTADQTAPRTTMGLDFYDNQLWVADFHAGEILAVDPDSHNIVRRLTSAENVSDEVTTVAVADDGTVYWTGFNDGNVGVLRGNQASSIGGVPAGTSSVALSPDGSTLFAGGAIAHPALLWRLDAKSQKAIEKSAVPVRLRSFAVSIDGAVYGPRFGPATAIGTQRTGALVKVDPVTGAEQDLVAVDSPIAVELSPDRLTAYVLSLPPGRPPALVAVTLATLAVTPLPSPRTPLVDDLAVAPDGRIFVSSYNSPDISVISPQGHVKLLTIGVRAPEEPRR